MAAKIEKKYYGAEQFRKDVCILRNLLSKYERKYRFVHGVPQGGVPLALALACGTAMVAVDREEMLRVQPHNTLVVDDLIDSGSTRARYPEYDFACLHAKKDCPPDIPGEYGRTFCVHDQHSEWANSWIVYWWEGTEEKSIDDSVLRQLQFIGEDVAREGLIETPARVIRSWDKLFGGYKQKAKDVIKVFKDKHCNEMILLKNIEFYSTCEHHMLPFFGKAHVAYVPQGGRVIGVSKLARLVEVFSRRLQIQERIGWQVTDALIEGIQPWGAACILEAQHFCMTSRGVEKQNSIMVTSSLKGVFIEKPETRAEFMELIK